MPTRPCITPRKPAATVTPFSTRACTGLAEGNSGWSRPVDARLGKRIDVEMLDLFPGPGSPAQKLEAGLHRGIVPETVDIDSSGQLVPAIVIHKLDNDTLERDAMQRVV